jgi:hypothetical protein
MVNVKDILELEKKNDQDRMVLSVYISGFVHDPAASRAWRMILEGGLAHERRRIFETAPEQLDDFDAAVTRMFESLPGQSAIHASHGWVGFFSPSRVIAAQALATPVTDLVAWDERARLLPLFRAQEQQSPVLVVLADKQKVRILRVRDNEQELLEYLERDPATSATYHMGDAPRPGFHAGVRGTTATDEAMRVRRDATRRMIHTAITRLEHLADAGCWIVLGGSPEGRNELHNGLPQHLRERTLADPMLAMRAAPAEILASAHRGAQLMRLNRAERLINSIVGLNSSSRKRALGLPQTFSALADHAVRSLFVSAGFIDSHPAFAEEVVRMALSQGAEMETISGPYAHLLDEQCAGIAARLRFIPVSEKAAS